MKSFILKLKLVAVPAAFILCAPNMRCHAQENHAPVIQIIAPAPNSSYPAGSRIPYTISVADAEDGDSKFNEINSSEVFLAVRYFSDPSLASMALNDSTAADPEALVLMQHSNCSNCHAFNAPSIGPSFANIATRYPLSKTNNVVLAQRLLSGTSGIWGTDVMPSHPEFSKEQSQLIIEWILKNAGNPDVRYYTGTKGSISLPHPSQATTPAIFLLRASYTDHGVDATSKPLEGHHSIMIHGH